MVLVNRWVDCARRAVLRAGRAAMLTLVRARRLTASGRAILTARFVWVAALAFVCLPPLLSPVAFVGGVATSSKVGLLLAACDHAQWGTQIIWTYGPTRPTIGETLFASFYTVPLTPHS
jgi:hypothetical protein